MNTLLLKKFSGVLALSDMGYPAREKQQRRRERMNISNEQIRYLDKVVILDGCSYSVNNRPFPSLDKALDYCKRLPIERCKKIWGAGIPISITNPKVSKVFDCTCLPAGLLVKDSKRPSRKLCKPPDWCRMEAPIWRFAI